MLGRAGNKSGKPASLTYSNLSKHFKLEGRGSISSLDHGHQPGLWVIPWQGCWAFLWREVPVERLKLDVLGWAFSFSSFPWKLLGNGAADQLWRFRSPSSGSV